MMSEELQTDNLMEKAKQIMKQLLKDQGIESEIVSKESSSQSLQKLFQSSAPLNSLDCVEEEDEDSRNSKNTSQQSNNYQNFSFSQEPTKQCSYQILWKTPSDQQEFFIYGGYCINFSFNREPDSAILRIGRPLSHSIYYPQKGIFLIYYSPVPPSHTNIEPLIERALSVGDIKYKHLADALASYQNKINWLISIRQNFPAEVYSEQFLNSYDWAFKQFEDWAIREVSKMDLNYNIFAFTIHKFNLRTREFDKHVTGQSKGMMILRGYDIKDPSSHFYRQCYHYLDGQSNLDLLINQLLQRPKGMEIKKQNANVLSFDGLKIEVELKCSILTNRDQSYPFLEFQMPNSPLKFEFSINLCFMDIPVETLRSLIQIRRSRTNFESAQFEDFSYSMESQIFLDRFYQSKKRKREFKMEQENMNNKDRDDEAQRNNDSNQFIDLIKI